MQETNGSSSNLIIGIILGVLIVGGVLLYMRSTTSAPKSNGSADINVTLPTTQDETNGR
ncbi:hypothetical protein H7X65_01590 [Candidatus Parcubacteria bacterium]|nr:hypothetical protein [Candidatus Parcubacteria bacterium]